MAQEQPAPFPDTVHFLDAANDSARNFRAVYVAYLIIASYIVVTIFSADDELLFRNGNVQIPIINTSATVEKFFIFAPLILLFLHLNVLMQAMFLSTKVRRYTSALDDDRNTPAFCIKKINAPSLLFPAPLAHFLVTGGQQKSAQSILWVVVVFISLVLLPPIIFIYAEIHFLPYQSELATWLHRIAILLDILLLWCLWPHIITPDEGWGKWWRKSPWKRWAATFVSVATGFFVIVIADIPGGTMENFISANTLRDWFEPGLDRRYQLESRILVQEEPSPEILATHFAACKSQNSDDRTDCQTEIKPGSPIWCRHAKPLSLQRRDLRYANLHNVILCDVDLSVDLSNANLSMARLHGADLRNTKLQGTDLREIKLQGADLGKVELQCADLSKAELQCADLGKAELQGANLRSAKLQGADLREAKLQGADLRRAELQDANLRSAELQGANLRSAKLQGANLRSAKLQGANLRKAKLQGANLRSAELQGANLRSAKLQGANLRSTQLQGANLRKAKLQGANLRSAELQGADLYPADLQGANLRSAKLQGTDLRKAELQGANLRSAKLQGANLRRTELQGADLRDVDLASKPDQEQLQKAIAIIKNIKQQERRDQALKLVKRAETEEATIIAPSSIEDAIFSDDSALYRQLQEPENRALLKDHHFTQTREDDYDTKVVAYLINSLSCRDEDNYVAKGIIHYRILEDENRKLTSIFAKKLNLDSTVPSLLCQGVEKPLDRLSEEERTELREIFAESANQ